VPVEQDVDLGEPGPEPDGPAGHRGPEPDLLPGDPEIVRRRDQPVQFHGLALPAAEVRRVRRSRPVTGFGFSGGSGKPRLHGQLGGYPQAETLASWGAEPGGGEGHVQALVRPGGVVVLAPGVHRSLGVLHAGERPADVEQFQLQGLGRVG
jgi:hypothetical protein